MFLMCVFGDDGGGGGCGLQGKNRTVVIALAEQLGIRDHHVPQSFLQLYFRKLQKQKKNPPLPTTAAAASDSS